MANALFSIFKKLRNQDDERRAGLTLLKPGDSGDAIRIAQQRLTAMGFPCGTVDGQYGDKTTKAVKRFQQSVNLPATGEIDGSTLQALGYEVDYGDNDVPGSAPLPGYGGGGSSGSSPLNVNQVSAMFPGAPLQNIRTYLPLVMDALVEYNLADKEMVLVALATIRAETGAFAPISEGQSSYNTASGGTPFAKYDFRRDIGNNAVGDGARYKGRGFIQLTGKSNYETYGQKIGMGDSLVRQPDLANDPGIAARLLACFLKDKESMIRNALSRNDFATARKAVNGGTNGLDNFISSYRTGARELSV